MKSNLQLAKQNSRMVYKGDHLKPSVGVKDTSIQTDKNISKGNGTEV